MTEVAKILGYFFRGTSHVLILTKHWLGYILGDFFYNPIWSPCLCTTNVPCCFKDSEGQPGESDAKGRKRKRSEVSDDGAESGDEDPEGASNGEIGIQPGERLFASVLVG
jgi:hypothetical protein